MPAGTPKNGRAWPKLGIEGHRIAPSIRIHSSKAPQGIPHWTCLTLPHEANTFCETPIWHTQKRRTVPGLAGTTLCVEVRPVVANVNVADFAALTWCERKPAFCGDTPVLVSGSPWCVLLDVGDHNIDFLVGSIAES